ncbi:hypothetical protein JDV02_006480 [Purpureocillium takamizusanense]|uniref:Uncharacterized protein n=1 Tax=Purpureocillium takamizusanense TaxID=2060973 RepID=A0A9Q8VD15_9HYPO|nr:uncharacterized protein JDV02_006480 [Purpureocillium takamizusanense]UNI20387.1 hypothetical protein JDV02_006480 [Purpureocillium takamizusanense]
MAAVAVAATGWPWAQAAPEEPASANKQTRARQQQMEATPRLASQAEQSNTTGPTEGNCAALLAARDKAAKLFTRTLNKGEYYERDFMWMRCRYQMENNLFDFGGSWPGPDGRDLFAFLEEKTDGDVRELAFDYVNARNAEWGSWGGWGDATAMLQLWGGVSSSASVEHLNILVAFMIQFGQLVAERERRTFYVVGCPAGAPNGTYFRGWGVEKKGIASYFTGGADNHWSTGGN